MQCSDPEREEMWLEGTIVSCYIIYRPRRWLDTKKQGVCETAYSNDKSIYSGFEHNSFDVYAYKGRKTIKMQGIDSEKYFMVRSAEVVIDDWAHQYDAGKRGRGMSR